MLNIGIIGFGRIGQRAAEIARAFGMRTVAYNRSQSERGAQLAEYLPLEEQSGNRLPPSGWSYFHYSRESKLQSFS